MYPNLIVRNEGRQNYPKNCPKPVGKCELSTPRRPAKTLAMQREHEPSGPQKKMWRLLQNVKKPAEKLRLWPQRECCRGYSCKAWWSGLERMRRWLRLNKARRTCIKMGKSLPEKARTRDEAKHLGHRTWVLFRRICVFFLNRARFKENAPENKMYRNVLADVECHL